MTDRILNFYESLADDYHLIFEDWNGTIHRQAKILDSILSARIPLRPLKILDCACGIGTQALGLAALGHQIVASDLSRAEVSRARREADARDLGLTFHVSDMTSLTEIVE